MTAIDPEDRPTALEVAVTARGIAARSRRCGRRIVDERDGATPARIRTTATDDAYHGLARRPPPVTADVAVTDPEQTDAAAARSAARCGAAAGGTTEVSRRSPVGG